MDLKLEEGCQMDFSHELDEGLSHSLCAELTVWSDSFSSLAESASSWLGEAVMESANGIGNLCVSPMSEVSVQLRPYSEESMEWVAREIEKRPASVSVEVGKVAHGEVVTSSPVVLTAKFDERLTEYVKLVYEVSDADLLSDGTGKLAQNSMLRSIQNICATHNVVFAHFSYANFGGRTSLERHIRGRTGSPTFNTPLWRDSLRGYSWIMVIPSEVVSRLGGVSEIEGSGAFYEVREMPNGSVWMRATEDFADYGEDSVRAVWSLLKDVLISGVPARGSVYPGDPPTCMTVFPE
jgi:hypothetical protein